MITTRRQLLKYGLASIVSPLVIPIPGFQSAIATERKKLPVAAVVTAYHNASHADVIVGKILEGWQHDGGTGPQLQIVAVYVDQFPESDISREKSKKYGFPICATIDEALTGGTDRLRVAGVLSIAEHGDYPRTPDTQQKQYPRRRFLDEINKTFDRVGKVVPVFNDKHLGYRWEDASAMVEGARKRKYPLLAGSSVPLAWRYPETILPLETEIEAAVSIGYGGLEDYGFHALEMHQSMLERRKGGEAGVVRVKTTSAPQIRTAESRGEWSSELFAAARKVMPGNPLDTTTWVPRDDAAVYHMTHADGLKSSVIMANGLAGHFAFACKIKGQKEPYATWFKLQEGWSYNHFGYLVRAIEELIHTQKSPYPIERTLLTTGILDRVMHSLANDGKDYETPELNFRYAAGDFPFANHPDSPLSLPNG